MKNAQKSKGNRKTKKAKKKKNKDWRVRVLLYVKNRSEFLGPKSAFFPPQRALRTFFLQRKVASDCESFCDYSREEVSPLVWLGGEEPSHLRVVPPGQRSCDDQCLEIVLAMLRIRVLAWCLVGFRLVSALISAVLSGNPRTAKCWDRTRGVVDQCSLCVRYCISGAVPVAGGSLEPSVPRSP